MISPKKRNLIISINNFICLDNFKQNKYFYDKILDLEMNYIYKTSYEKLKKKKIDMNKAFNNKQCYKKILYEYYIEKYINHIEFIDLINNYLKSDMDNYLNICILPDFERYNLIQIIYWIDNVIVKDKERKKKNDFLYDIYIYQKEENNEKKNDFLKIILNKLINYLKYANKK